MRFLVVLLLALIAAAGAAFAYVRLTAGPAIVLARPTLVQASAGGKLLEPGQWTSSHDVVLKADPVEPAGIDVDVQRIGARLSDVPTASSATPSVTIHLTDGRYRWAVRLHNSRGISRWAHGPGPIEIDGTPPTAPQISSPTDPSASTTYHSSTATFQWQSSDALSGVAGYSYRLDADPNGSALTAVRTTQPSVTLSGLTTGRWYFHVRSVDRAGNWSADTTFPIHIDVTPPQLEHVRFNLFQFNPQFDHLTLSFALTKPATHIRVGLYNASGRLVRLYTLGTTQAGTTASITWDGKTARGQTVPSGSYEVYVRAIDRYGHSSLQGWRDIVVDYKKIVVSLSQQRLYAYDGNRLVVSTLVTTGNKALPTPTGTYRVMARFHPYKFISPWPKSSRYYYPPSPVNWALYFRQGGYFIHDAPWRSAYGPGTNSVLGTPGQNYTGTHGCVNVPESVMKQLYAWAQVGTVVQVVN
ncbi:MAG TPA: L,D-transpeptidase family protein [Chloroflexota bacterium]|nr:L,D-transpeptidase family protein [Chloroflexota bacterium]